MSINVLVTFMNVIVKKTQLPDDCVLNSIANHCIPAATGMHIAYFSMLIKQGLDKVQDGDVTA
ncbi:hypothetical protein A3860_06460 [Niastella vici]|uniref:Uncharacterized protein n=1 Tax=Niastella vici TaxID=1703345 RepID=A0A1V9FSJ2_9BACT|nr:hypothetical protein A3860_06460 [Niastella vici]